MIEFKGELSKECKDFLLKVDVKLQAVVILPMYTIFLIAVILTAIYWNIKALICIIPLLIMVVGSLIKPGKSAQQMIVPKRVYVDLEEETIVHEAETMERFHMISSVKSLIDYGEWYHFVFNYEDRDPYFVCQKSLLTQGSLEELEALFAGKIIRKK